MEVKYHVSVCHPEELYSVVYSILISSVCILPDTVLLRYISTYNCLLLPTTRHTSNPDYLVPCKFINLYTFLFSGCFSLVPTTDL